jgi:Holliday junction DNA helicase RuvB
MTLTFDDCVGNEESKNKIKLLYSPAIRDRFARVADLAVIGPSGNGKTTFVEAGAKYIGRRFHKFNSTAIKNPFAIRAIVSDPPSEGMVILFDECHQLPGKIQDSLLNALESGKDGKRVLTTAVKDTIMNDYLPENISFAFATTHSSYLRHALRTRLHTVEMHPYTTEEHKEIAYRYFKRHYNLDRDKIDADAITDIAFRSRCGRDVANNCDTIWLVMCDKKADKLTKDITSAAFTIIGVDQFGLTKMDRKLLSFLAQTNTFVGLETLEAAMEMPKEDIKKNIEPYLLRQNYMVRMSSGRLITDKGKLAVSLLKKGV